MTIKRILAAGLIFGMVFSLTGCGEKEVSYDPLELDQFADASTELDHNFFILSARDGMAYPTIDQGINENHDHWYLTEEQLENVKELGKDDQLIYTNLAERPSIVQLTKFDELGYTVGTNFTVIDNTQEDENDTGEDGINTGNLISANLDNTVITFGSVQNPFSPVGAYMQSYLNGSEDSNGEIADNENIQIKKINGLEFKTSMLTSSGYLKGLTKDAMYKFGYYKGTHYGEITIKADSLLLYANGVYQTASISEMEDTYFVINLPTNLENGYYYIDGFGLFKYTAKDKSLEDKKSIGGEAEGQTQEESSQQEGESSHEQQTASAE